MDLSVVIVNWNSGSYLERLLTSLSPFADEVTILVVDNASQDSSPACVEKWAQARLIRWDSNRGFAAAANEGIRRAESSYVLLVNPDVSVYPDGVRLLLQKLEEDPGAGLAAGYLEDEQHKLQKSFQLRPFPTVSGVISDAIFLDELLAPFKTMSVHADGPDGQDCRTIEEQPAAAFWLLRRSVWEELGGFDEDFAPAWFEDVDFCLRLKEQGWRILFCSRVVGQHQGGISLNHLSRTKFLKIFYGNLLLYWRKHHPSTLPLIWLPVKLGVCMRMIGTEWRR